MGMLCLAMALKIKCVNDITYYKYYVMLIGLNSQTFSALDEFADDILFRCRIEKYQAHQ